MSGLKEKLKAFSRLEAERVVIRKIEKKDEPALVEMANDFEIKKFWGYYDEETGVLHDEFETPEGAPKKSFYENVSETYKEMDELRLVIALKETDEAIGEIMLYYFMLDKQAEIGYRISRNFWGAGYATEAVSTISDYAFDTLSLTKLVLRCFAENVGSKKVAERAGFLQEGFVKKGCIVKVCKDYYLFGKVNPTHKG